MMKKTIQKEKSLRHDILSRLYDIRKSFVRNYEIFLPEEPEKAKEYKKEIEKIEMEITYIQKNLK